MVGPVQLHTYMKLQLKVNEELLLVQTNRRMELKYKVKSKLKLSLQEAVKVHRVLRR
jgi:hypothetical protein